MCNDDTFMQVQREFEQWRDREHFKRLLNEGDCFQNNSRITSSLATSYDGVTAGFDVIHVGRCNVENDLVRLSPSASYRIWELDPRDM